MPIGGRDTLRGRLEERMIRVLDLDRRNPMCAPDPQPDLRPQDCIRVEAGEHAAERSVERRRVGLVGFTGEELAIPVEVLLRDADPDTEKQG